MLYLLLTLPRNAELKKEDFLSLLYSVSFFLDIYNSIYLLYIYEVKQAALSRLKLPVRFPARNRAGALDLLAMPALYSTKVRSRGRRLPPTLQKKFKSMDEVRKST